MREFDPGKPTGHPRERFARQPITGPAYGLLMKGMATAVMIGIAFTSMRAFGQTSDLLDTNMRAGLAAVAALIFGSYCALLRSTMTIDGEGLRQSWMAKRRIRWDEIEAMRFVRMHGGARLLVKLSDGRVVAMNAGSDLLSRAFELMSRWYPVA
ncbi:PH domain-containing protein [Derxia gummosa]|uniref:PH domain-containing protein n=1 Tax=Derxia gummosa DSM 723 TaxID=1121388 RepID=A0A8B6X4U0_9BURK|nr:PH domain-containing protein [Derxia gummosa]